MTASHPTQIAPFEWWYDDFAAELDDAAVHGLEGMELETMAPPVVEEELVDDEIGRASEELHEDEG